MLSCLAAQQGTAGLNTSCGDALDDSGNPVGVDVAARNVVGDEPRLSTHHDEIVDEPDLLSRWETLAECPDNFFAVLIEATFRLDARDALLHLSAGRCLLEFLEGRPEIERLIREFPAPTLLRSKFV